MHNVSESHVKDLSKVGETKTNIRLRKDAKVIQYKIFTTKGTKSIKAFPFNPLVSFVTVVPKKSKNLVMRSIDNDAIGQAGMIQSGGRSAV